MKANRGESRNEATSSLVFGGLVGGLYPGDSGSVNYANWGSWTDFWPWILLDRTPGNVDCQTKSKHTYLAVFLTV